MEGRKEGTNIDVNVAGVSDGAFDVEGLLANVIEAQLQPAPVATQVVFVARWRCCSCCVGFVTVVLRLQLLC